MPNHIKIPREIIYGLDIGDKRAIIFSYLCSRRTIDETVAFSISELCHWSHLKPNYHDGKINQKYLETLQFIADYGYFQSYPDFIKIFSEKNNSNTYYNVSIFPEKFDPPDNFGIIYLDELQKILNFKGELSSTDIDLSRISSAQILLLLSYLRLNMNRDNSRPLCCYRLYSKITEDIGLSERYVSRIVDILGTLNIVKSKEGKRIRYQKDTNKYGFTTAPKVFADYQRYVRSEYGQISLDLNYDYRKEIDRQIEILSQSTFCN